ncbi:MAG TPA: hypothetical protein VKB46_13760 [Pyrinomonadaceae bacterium]|nr:hypothetical protein [Pyrinomonadaceae bacterium]
MKRRALALTLPLFLVAVALGATSPHMGTWKLNEAKSKIPAGALKNNTVVYEAVGDQIKVTVDGVDGSGNAAHNEWTGKFDGKDYAVTGDSTVDTRSYRQINSRTLAITNKKDGKVTTSGRIVVSANGKSRTVTTTSTDAKGKKSTTVAFYDKQ